MNLSLAYIRIAILAPSVPVFIIVFVTTIIISLRLTVDRLAIATFDVVGIDWTDIVIDVGAEDG